MSRPCTAAGFLGAIALWCAYPCAVRGSTAADAAAADLDARLAAARRAARGHRPDECARRFADVSRRLANGGDSRASEAAHEAGRCAARAGRVDQAFALLSKAVVYGSDDAGAAERDPALAGLRADARWPGLIQRMRARPARHNPALRAVLVRLGNDDQEDLLLGLRGERGARTDGDLERIATLKQIIAEFGWPGIGIAGFDGARGAWLVAQHADRDPAFQRECLQLVTRAYEAGEVTGLQLAYLTDRVRSAEGRPQPYATQGAPVLSSEERRQVELRREAVGLPSIDELNRLRSERYEEDYASGGQSRPDGRR